MSIITERKLLLEKVYKEYCEQDLQGVVSSINNPSEYDDDLRAICSVMEAWIPFRLMVSGGAHTSMGSVGMETVQGFLNEIEYFDDLICADGMGAYRGDYRYECRDALFQIIDREIKEEDFVNTLKEEYDRAFNIEE